MQSTKYSAKWVLRFRGTHKHVAFPLTLKDWAGREWTFVKALPPKTGDDPGRIITEDGQQWAVTAFDLEWHRVVLETPGA